MSNVLHEAENCRGCGEPEDEKRAWHTFWMTAEFHGLQAGMWHDECFWDAVKKKTAQ